MLVWGYHFRRQCLRSESSRSDRGPRVDRSPAAAPGLQRQQSPAAVSPKANIEADAAALLEQIGESYLRFAPEGATSLGIDTGARAGAAIAARRSIGRRPAEDRERSGRISRRRKRSMRPDSRMRAHEHRGRAKRVSDRVRWFRAAVRRHHRRQLAQYAVRGDPERRRLPRSSALSRQRPSNRERR